MTKFRKLILVLFFIGFAGNVGGGAGTFASFNASTTNPGSTFASGSIVLSNQKNTSTVCYSNGTNYLTQPGGTASPTDNNANSNCETLFTGLTTQRPGQSATVNLTLTNEGDLPGTLTLYAPGGCTPGTTGPYSGSLDICGYLKLTVQRYTDADRDTVYSGDTDGCVYGNASTDTCAIDTAGTVGTYASTHTSGNPISLGTVDAGDSVWLTATVKFPDTGAGAENGYMGRTAAWAFTWLLEQLPVS